MLTDKRGVEPAKRWEFLLPTLALLVNAEQAIFQRKQKLAERGERRMPSVIGIDGTFSLYQDDLLMREHRSGTTQYVDFLSFYVDLENVNLRDRLCGAKAIKGFDLNGWS